MNGQQLESAWYHGEDDGSNDTSSGGVSAQEAGYLTPDQGPFTCSNCIYFVAENEPCQKVAEPVQAEGCCDLFQNAGAQLPEAEAMNPEPVGETQAPAGQTASY